MTKRFGITAALCLLLITPSFAYQRTRAPQNKISKTYLNLADTIDAIRPGVVQVYIKFTPPPPPPGQMPLPDENKGTGFFVSAEGHVITALHVITPPPGAVVTKRSLRLAYANTRNMRGTFAGIDFEVVGEDPVHDLALLKARLNPFAGEGFVPFVFNGKQINPSVGVLNLDPQRPRDGQSVAVSGYPFGNSIMITNTGYIASSWEVDRPFSPGEFDPQLFREGFWITDVYLADIRANPGNSGGPVYDVNTGKVLGVLSKVALAPVLVTRGGQSAPLPGDTQLSYNAGIAFLVPSRHVVSLLEKFKVKTRPPEVK